MNRTGMMIFGVIGVGFLFLPVEFWRDDLGQTWDAWEWFFFSESFFPSLLALWMVALCSGIVP